MAVFFVCRKRNMEKLDKGDYGMGGRGSSGLGGAAVKLQMAKKTL